MYLQPFTAHGISRSSYLATKHRGFKWKKNDAPAPQPITKKIFQDATEEYDHYIAELTFLSKKDRAPLPRALKSTASLYHKLKSIYISSKLIQLRLPKSVLESLMLHLSLSSDQDACALLIEVFQDKQGVWNYPQAPQDYAYALHAMLNSSQAMLALEFVKQLAVNFSNGYIRNAPFLRDTGIWTRLIELLDTEGRFDSILECWTFIPFLNVYLTVELLNSILNSLSHADFKYYDTILDIIQQMQASEWQTPNATTYTILLKLYLRTKKVEEGEDAYRKFLQLAPSFDADNLATKISWQLASGVAVESIFEDIFTYNRNDSSLSDTSLRCILDTGALYDRKLDARLLISHLYLKREDLLPIYSRQSTLLAENDFAIAALLRAAQGSSYEQSHVPLPISSLRIEYNNTEQSNESTSGDFKSLVNQYLREGKFNELYNLLDNKRQTLTTSDLSNLYAAVLNFISNNLQPGVSYVRSCEVLLTACNLQLPCHVYSAFVLSYSILNRSDLAWQTIGAMIESGHTPRAVDYGRTLTSITRSKDRHTLEAVHSHLREDQSLYLNTWLLNCIMNGYNFTGMSKEALEIWQEILHGPGPNQASFSIAIDTCTRTQDEGFDTLREIWKALSYFDMTATARIYATLVEAVAAKASHTEVFSVVESMPQGLVDGVVLSTVFNTGGKRNHEEIDSWAREKYPLLWAELRAKS